ncbi:hypothetical protein BKP64_12655 [Marinobacter salinus]|uniref:Uncharacterized protein n=1 Tax=Marinobacter salinus TaxID=1874317 RepID=A0A1D9GMT4_9GAMM|nr:hypothetical protein [Marinobacter salinus]AOY88946.1 hypothetical protein BKP64_12655 [Marinobacter salinus]
MKPDFSGLRAWLQCGILITGLALSVTASGNDDLDVTMRMVLDDSDITGSVVRQIKLPEAASLESRPPADRQKVQGVGRSGESGPGNRDFGQSVAEDVRQSRETVDSMREKAKRPSELIEQVQELQKDGPPGLNR